MNHIYETERYPLPAQHNFPIKIRKGKSKKYDNYGNSSTYVGLTNLSSSIDFIPPEKLIIPKSNIEKQAKSILTLQSHPALFRAYQILLAEDKTKEPDGQSWTHKFRPRRANEILTGHTQGVELRNWMAGNRKVVVQPKEMDDFIVDESDQEQDVVVAGHVVRGTVDRGRPGAMAPGACRATSEPRQTS